MSGSIGLKDDISAQGFCYVIYDFRRFDCDPLQFGSQFLQTRCQIAFSMRDFSIVT